MAKKKKAQPTKEEIKAQKKKEAEKKVEGLWKEFKKFITRGNVVDMSIGVVIGTAFGAIVTALTNILLNVCMWGVPGGLKGVFTVLPGFAPEWGQTLTIDQYVELINKSEETKIAINAQYTLHGNLYVYNGAAIIDWGAFINAVLSFFVIALTLFIIIKVFSTLQKKRAKMHEEALEKYYQKHPEARPAPVAPGLPEPTDHQLLKEILGELRAQNKTTKKSKTSKKK